MTGWIKMGVSLRSHPKVVRLASALKADKNRVLGGLFSVWCVFDAHSENGELEGYTLDAMDAEIGWRGFSAALMSIGWLEANEAGLNAPRFEEHNGATAKRRALDASRKGKSRTEAGQMSASDADKAGNREEKRREEKKDQEIAPTELPASPLRVVKPASPPPAFDGSNAEVLNGKSVVALSTTWDLPDEWGVDAEALGWRRSEVLLEAEKFRQYWTAGKGSGTRRAVKSWRQTWSNWLGKAAERKQR